MTSKLMIKNIGAIVSGDLSRPLLDGDTLCASGDTISFIGSLSQAPHEEYDTVIDAGGLSLLPGLIDANIHPPLGNYLERFKAYDWVDNYAGAGITGMVSAGSDRFTGAARDREGAKIQALAARRLWRELRPCGVKLHADAVVPVRDMTEEDFRELSQAGIRVLGELGAGPVKEVEEAAAYAGMARNAGMKSLLHTGGPADREGVCYSLEDIQKIRPDALCHVNGAPTPMGAADMKELVQSGRYQMDTASNGNMKSLLNIGRWAAESGNLDKLMLGTNAPSMAGYSPMGLLIQMAILSSYADIPPEEAVALATGNISRFYDLDHGILQPGYKADLIFGETGSPMPDLLSTLRFGRVPSVAGTVVDGRFTLARCKNTAPPKRRPLVHKARRNP